MQVDDKVGLVDVYNWFNHVGQFQGFRTFVI